MVEDCPIAAILLHLTATDLGLGSCWVQIRLRHHDDQQTAQDYVAGLVGLKAGMVVEAIVAVGYPAENLPGHSVRYCLMKKSTSSDTGRSED